MNLRLIPVPQPQSKTRSPALRSSLFTDSRMNGSSENQAIVYPTTQTIDAHCQPSLRQPSCDANKPNRERSGVRALCAWTQYDAVSAVTGTGVPISFLGGRPAG